MRLWCGKDMKNVILNTVIRWKNVWEQLFRPVGVIDRVSWHEQATPYHVLLVFSGIEQGTLFVRLADRSCPPVRTEKKTQFVCGGPTVMIEIQISSLMTW